jgi:hypothetical protein
MSDSITFPFGLEDLDPVFAVTDLLDNKDELIKEFIPEVSKILVKKNFFTGHFRTKYNEMFDDLITSLIRKQITSHLRLSPEQILLLTETGFLKMIAPTLFEPDSYLSKEGTTDVQ